MKSKNLLLLAITTYSLVAFSPATAVEPYITGALGSADPADDRYESDIAYKIGAGLDVSSIIDVEVAYTDLGTFDLDTNQRHVSGGIDASGFEASTLIKTPMSSKTQLTGRLGMFMWETKETAKVNYQDGGSSQASKKSSGTDPFFGIGINHQLSNNFSVRGEYLKYNVLEGDVAMFNAGAKMKFF